MLSEHTTATEAEFVALAHAEDGGAERVVVHDRYHRTHDARPAPSNSDPGGVVWTTGLGTGPAHDSPNWSLPWWPR